MDFTAFASGAVVVAKTITSPSFCSSTSRDVVASPRQGSVVLRHSSFVSAVSMRRNCGCVGACGGHGPSTPKMTLAVSVGEQVIQDLLKENEAFVRGEFKVFPGVPEERARLSKEGQAPKVAIIACADSRVAPEILFRANVGDLFIMRVAGNTTWGEEVHGSLQFAIDVLGVSAVMVLGHTKCGAVAAAVGGGELPGDLGAHVKNIANSLELRGCKSKDVDHAVEINVHAAIDYLRKDPNSAVSRGEKNGLVVRGAVYDITTGRVQLV